LYSRNGIFSIHVRWGGGIPTAAGNTVHNTDSQREGMIKGRGKKRTHWAVLWEYPKKKKDCENSDRGLVEKNFLPL